MCLSQLLIQYSANNIHSIQINDRLTICYFALLSTVPNLQLFDQAGFLGLQSLLLSLFLLLFQLANHRFPFP